MTNEDVSRRCMLTGAASAVVAMSAPLRAWSQTTNKIRIAVGASSEAKAMAALAARALGEAGFKTRLVAAPSDSDALADLAAGHLHAHPNLMRAGAESQLRMAISMQRVRSLGGRRNNRSGEAAMKIVWPGMKRKWSNAQKLLKRMIVPDRTVAALAARIDAGAAPETAIDEWWAENRKTWSPWIAASKNWMKP